MRRQEKEERGRVHMKCKTQPIQEFVWDFNNMFTDPYGMMNGSTVPFVTARRAFGSSFTPSSLLSARL